MNKLSLKQTVTMAGVALSVTLFSAPPAKAASFTFSQGGWKYGGNLLGSFSGDDVNNNGEIERTELSSFNATFSGNLYGDFPNPTGKPIITPFTLSSNLLYSSPAEPIFLSFNYSISTSELSFYSFGISCNYKVLGSCRQETTYQFISASNTGGSASIQFNTYDGKYDFGTSSISAPRVTPVQPVPEPTTLAGLLFGGLGFLLRRKVVSSSI